MSQTGLGANATNPGEEISQPKLKETMPLPGVVSYILRSIQKASEFMVERAWFDVLSLFAATTFPGGEARSYERVIFVVFLSVMIYSFTEALNQRDAEKISHRNSRDI